MFILWGKFAQVAYLAYLGTYLGRISRRFSPHAFGELQNKGKFISRSKHCVIETAHPSPLSVTKFLGCRCFSKVREEIGLRLQGDYREIAWRSRCSSKVRVAQFVVICYAGRRDSPKVAPRSRPLSHAQWHFAPRTGEQLPAAERRGGD